MNSNGYLNRGADELAAIAEERFRQRGSGDSYTPAFMSIDANGRIGFNFTGRVHALGLDLDAPDTLVPPDEDRVRWLRLTDGSVAADITANNFGDNAGIMDVRAYAPNPHLGPARLQLSAEADNSPGSGVNDGLSRLTVERNTTGLPGTLLGKIYANIVNETNTYTIQRRLLASDQSSDFMLARGCHAFFFSSANTNVANTATGVVNLRSTVYDVTDVQDATGAFLTQSGGATDRWICRRAGLYLALVQGLAQATAGFGNKWIMRVNGATVVDAGLNTLPNHFFFRPIELAVNDVIDLTVTNSTGAAANYTAWLMVSRIGSTLNWLG